MKRWPWQVALRDREWERTRHAYLHEETHQTSYHTQSVDMLSIGRGLYHFWLLEPLLLRAAERNDAIFQLRDHAYVCTHVVLATFQFFSFLLLPNTSKCLFIFVLLIWCMHEWADRDWLNELTPYDIKVVGAMGDSISVSCSTLHVDTTCVIICTTMNRLHLELMERSLKPV